MTSREEKIRRRQEAFKRLDDRLLILHREHPWKALALAFGVALVLAGLAWLLKISVIALAHWVTR